MNNKIYLYKRGIGLAKELVCDAEETERFKKIYKEKYDGIMIANSKYYVFYMDGYCGI